MGTLWGSFEWFLGALKKFLADVTKTAKIEWPKVTRKTPEALESSRKLPGAPESYPCVPLQEQSKDWKDWKTGPMGIICP